MPDLRKARIATPLATLAGDGAPPLAAGDWFLEQHADAVRVYADPQGTQHVADLAVVVFLDGLARREIVFVSWG